MSENVTPVLSAKGLVKRYGSVTALDGADFELLPGEIKAIIVDIDLSLIRHKCA